MLWHNLDTRPQWGLSGEAGKGTSGREVVRRWAARPKVELLIYWKKCGARWGDLFLDATLLRRCPWIEKRRKCGIP